MTYKPNDKEIVKAYETIVNHLMNNATREEEKENFKNTPLRAFKALEEMCKPYDKILEEVAQHLSVSFPVVTDTDDNEEGSSFKGSPGFVVQGPVKVFSLCPHHLQVLRSEIFVAYAPKDRQPLGLSKLARVCEAFGRRPVLQEQLACDISEALFNFEYNGNTIFESHGSIVQVVASHNCMSARGVKSDALTAVTELRGVFWDEGMEQKFISHVEAIHRYRR